MDTHTHTRSVALYLPLLLLLSLHTFLPSARAGISRAADEAAD